MTTSGSDIADKMHKFPISGNIVPPVWYQTIRRPNGKPYDVAITILADIVYWYRPTEIRDEGSGNFIGLKKKFKADLLQRSYQQLQEQFGYSEDQVKRAIKALEELGVVQRVFRNLVISGRCVNNIMYLKLIPDVLYKLTYPDDLSSETSLSTNISLSSNTDSVSGYMQTGACTNPETNTEITTETTTEITTTDYPSFNQLVRDFKEQIGYDSIASDLPDSPPLLDELVSVACDVLSSHANQLKIQGSLLPAGRVKDRLWSLTNEHMKYILDSIKKCRSEVTNPKAFLLAAMYNAPTTINTYYTTKVNHDIANS